MSGMESRDCGFTVVELVVVIILLGILSVYAVPRFVGVASFEESGFYQETVSAARYANRLAVGRGEKVRINFGQHGYTLCFPEPGGCEQLSDRHPVNHHSDKKINIDTNGTRNATFDALGRASQSLTVTVITDNGRSFTIIEETGYVDTSP